MCPDSPRIDEADLADTPDSADLFDPSTTGRVIVMQNVVPLLSTVGALIPFWLLFVLMW